MKVILKPGGFVIVLGVCLTAGYALRSQSLQEGGTVTASPLPTLMASAQAAPQDETPKKPAEEAKPDAAKTGEKLDSWVPFFGSSKYDADKNEATLTREADKKYIGFYKEIKTGALDKPMLTVRVSGTTGEWTASVARGKEDTVYLGKVVGDGTMTKDLRDALKPLEKGAEEKPVKLTLRFFGESATVKEVSLKHAPKSEKTDALEAKKE